MRKFLFTLLCAIVSCATLSAAPDRFSEVTVVVGHTLRVHPAGTLLVGVTPEEGEDFAKVSQEGPALKIEGVEPGLATFRLSLRYGQEMVFRVRVVAYSLAAPAQKPEKPKWTGTYQFLPPENYYCIAYSRFDSNGDEESDQILARIDDDLVNTDYFDKEGYWVFDRFDYGSSLGYNGGETSDGHFKYYYGDGNEISAENLEDGRAWFDEYAAQPVTMAVPFKAMELCDFGWDNNGDMDLEPGIV
nr:hypothetical protein [Bacteroidales bacterium]